MAESTPVVLKSALERLASGSSSVTDLQLIQQALHAEKIVIAGERSVAVGGDVVKSIIITGDVTGTFLIFNGDDATALREALQSIAVRPNQLSPSERAELDRAYLGEVIHKNQFWRDHYTPLAALVGVPSESASIPTVAPRQFLPRGFDVLVRERATREMDEHRASNEKIEHYDDVCDAIEKHGDLVLLGDPGAGKTTTLWRLMHEYAQRAITDYQLHDPAVKIPILINLGRYDGLSPTLDFLRTELVLSSKDNFANAVYPAHRRVAAHLEEYLDDGHLILLLDALNEMPQAHFADSVRNLEVLRDEHPGNRFIFTCRALDYTVKLDLPEAKIQDLNEDSQRDFLTAYFSDAGAQLLGTLRDSYKDLLELGSNPYMLLMIGQVYQWEGKLPPNPGLLLQSFVNVLLDREHKTHPDHWLDTEMQVRVLSDLAFAIQREHGSRTTVPREWANKYLTVDGHEAAYTPTDFLYIARSASILDEAADGSLRFTHQLLQEYFAAVALLRFVAQDQALEAARYYSWDEALVLLAGLMDDATTLVEFVMPIDPYLASRCVGATRVVSSDTRDRLIQRLVAKLNSRLENERIQAVQAMAELRSDSIIPHLLAQLKHTPVREATVEEWNRLESISNAVIKALSHLKAETIIQAIFPLLNDSNWFVRRAAVEILGKLDSTMTISQLVPMLKDKESLVRAATVRALRTLRDEALILDLLPLLNDRDWDVRMAVVNGLAAFKSEIVIPRLVQLLKNRDSGLRQSSAWALGVLKLEAAIPNLITLLKDPEQDVRAAAASALGAFSPSVALPMLTPLLKDKDPKVREGTAWALGLLKSETSIRNLILLLKDKHPRVREAAATALKDLKAEDAIPHLALLLRDKDVDVRMSAEATLVQFDSEAVVPQLIPLLADKEAGVRQVAVMALGDLKATTATHNIKPLLEDKDDKVRAAAVFALRQLQSKEAIPRLATMLNEDSPLSKAVVETLGAMQSDMALPYLLTQLNNNDPQMREAAAWALAQLKPEGAIPHLITLLNDESRFVQHSAIRILGMLNADAATPYILAFLKEKSPTLRSEAIQALKASTTEKHLSLFLPLLSNDNSYDANAAFEIVESVKRRLNLPKDYAFPNPDDLSANQMNDESRSTQ